MNDVVAITSADSERPRDLALDGIRGIAVLLVLAYHFIDFWARPGHGLLEKIVFSAARAGEYGVGIFFVLSGFLITGILLGNRTRPHYFRSFYGRRVLRIFPLYYATLAVLLFVLPALGVDNFLAYRAHQRWLWGYAVNIAWIFIPVDWGYLNHFWTLALEEQFYLIWPAVVWRCPARWLAALCYAALIALLVMRAAVFNHDPQGPAVFAMAWLQADGLFAGALLALAVYLKKPVKPLGLYITTLVSLIALIAIFPALVRSDRWTIVVKFSLITVLISCIFVMTLFGYVGGTLRSWAQWRLFRAFGKYSYAIYVFHYPILPMLARILPVSRFAGLTGYLPAVLIFAVLSTLITLGLAYASWHLMEKHFLRLKRYFPSAEVADLEACNAATAAFTAAKHQSQPAIL